MNQEKEQHKAIQKMRNIYHHYIQDNIEDVNDFDKQQSIKNYAQGVNNKFVDILILNELIHKEAK